MDLLKIVIIKEGFQYLKRWKEIWSNQKVNLVLIYHKEYMQYFQKQIFGRDKKFYMYLTYSYYISFQVFSPFN